MACAPTLTGPLAAEPTALPNEQAARAATLPVTPSSPRLPRSLMHSPCCSRCWHAGQVEHGRPASLCVRCLHRLAARASAALPPPGGHAPQCHQRRAHPAPARPPPAGAPTPRRRAPPAPARSPRAGRLSPGREQRTQALRLREGLAVRQELAAVRVDVPEHALRDDGDVRLLRAPAGRPALHARLPGGLERSLSQDLGPRALTRKGWDKERGCSRRA